MDTREEDDEIEEGTETEADLGKQNPDLYSKAVMWGTDWTAETIIGQLKKKNIDLNPDFQRRDAWDPGKKSKFIESLILGLPVPPIILAERKDKKNSFLVIDGKQRLLSIMQFCTKEDESLGFERLYLQKLDILTNLNGSNYSLMQANEGSFGYINQFDNQTIRTVVVKNWPNEQFLYTLFLRLNTGSLKLSPQELRQALHPGPFLSYISRYSEDENPVRKLLHLRKADSRMRDIELILRYFAFKNFKDSYGDSLKKFMDDTCSKINIDWETNSGKYIGQLDSLNKAISFTTEIFGEKYRFRKFIKGEYSSIFNRTIFDLMVYYFSDEETRNKLEGKNVLITSRFEKLMTSNFDFIEATNGSTKDREKTLTRFKLFKEMIHSISES